ncbi:MAG: metallophosphoesterase [Bacillales bacterium]|nr:metallophosphoesterase [Bacillales bacterium]
MSFIQEKLINLTIGVSKEYRLIQFSDVHAVTCRCFESAEAIEKAIKHENLWMKQRLDFAERFNENYDSRFLLSSLDCLDRLINYCNKKRPDLVLLTGDIIDYYSEANLDLLHRSVMKLTSPYLFSRGNHESPSDKFKEMCHGKGDFNYFDFGEFLVVSIDNAERTISQLQVDALRKMLALKKPMIFMMHVPIVNEYNEEEFKKLDAYYSIRASGCDETTKEFINLLCSSSEVRAIFCGHTHGAIYSLVAPGKPQYCCSSGLIGNVNMIIVR